MDRDAELMESMLNTAESMDILSEELDKISLHSFVGSESRESSHSNSKYYDSAIGSHYSEDSSSIHSQTARHAETQLHTASPHFYHKKSRHYDTNDQNIVTYSEITSSKESSFIAHSSSRRRTSRNLPEMKSTSVQVSSSVVFPMQAEVLYIPSHDPSPLITMVENPPYPAEPLAYNTSYQPTLDIKVSADVELNGSGSSTPMLQSSLSSSTNTSNSSGINTPINKRGLSEEPQPIIQRPLTPRVTIVCPGEAKADINVDIASSPRQPRIPKKGTVFYQDTLNPPQSPHLRAYRERQLANGREEPSRSPLSARRNIPSRTPSILQRLIRKRGSFKQERLVKRRLPVKRSLSNRITYHIKKGWIDYEEDLNFISQPSQPRAVGRMVDKKAGKYHMVQLFRPAGGRYGIYISQTTGRKGVFISRFADQTAAKFYNGLISPGDQIIRVNGKNIAEQDSVDDVYDLMTASDSVIFTVIPIGMRADW